MEATQMQEGQRTITATYSIGSEITEEQARELISSNAPNGFSVENVELNQDQESQ